MNSQNIISAVERIRAQVPMIDFRDKRMVLANLIFMHQVMTASERLLFEAANETTGDLRAYYFAHMEEERGHVQWLADDLKSVGINVALMPKVQAAIALAGSQYYLMKHISPFALLGYMLVLEGFPVAMEYVELLEVAHGKELFRTLRYHSEHDIEHRKELFSMIDVNPSAEIMDSATLTATYINEFFTNLQSSALWEVLKDKE